MLPDFLLAEIIANPDDDASRLIASDWLEQYGQSFMAEFIRVQCDIYRRFGVPADGSSVVTGDKEADADEVRLRKREQELLAILDRQRHASVHFGSWEFTDLNWEWTWRRGFIEDLTLGFDQWLTVHRVVMSCQPVRTLRLTDVPTNAAIWSKFEQQYKTLRRLKKLELIMATANAADTYSLVCMAQAILTGVEVHGYAYGSRYPLDVRWKDSEYELSLDDEYGMVPW